MALINKTHNKMRETLINQEVAKFIYLERKSEIAAEGYQGMDLDTFLTKELMLDTRYMFKVSTYMDLDLMPYKVMYAIPLGLVNEILGAYELKPLTKKKLNKASLYHLCVLSARKQVAELN